MQQNAAVVGSRECFQAFSWNCSKGGMRVKLSKAASAMEQDYANDCKRTEASCCLSRSAGSSQSSESKVNVTPETPAHLAEVFVRQDFSAFHDKASYLHQPDVQLSE